MEGGAAMEGDAATEGAATEAAGAAQATEAAEAAQATEAAEAAAEAAAEEVAVYGLEVSRSAPDTKGSLALHRRSARRFIAKRSASTFTPACDTAITRGIARSTQLLLPNALPHLVPG